jgi:hypothetical protein
MFAPDSAERIRAVAIRRLKRREVALDHRAERAAITRSTNHRAAIDGRDVSSRILRLLRCARSDRHHVSIVRR